jgi:hypothetical protein
MKYLWIWATRNLSEAYIDRKFKFKFARPTRLSCARGHHLLLHAAPAQLISLAAVIGAALPVAVSRLGESSQVQVKSSQVASSQVASGRKTGSITSLTAPRLLACQ